MLIPLRALAVASLGASGLAAQIVVPGLAADLVCCYDFEHPLPVNPNRESDLGTSNTPLDLINGGAAMRGADGAFPASTFSLQTKQVNPTTTDNDDWKAGLYTANGTPSLAAFSGVRGITLMGWIKPTGNHPAPNSTTADPADVYNAVGLFGLLTGDSEGHAVRALVEIITVSGPLRLVALGRRIDGGSSRLPSPRPIRGKRSSPLTPGPTSRPPSTSTRAPWLSIETELPSPPPTPRPEILGVSLAGPNPISLPPPIPQALKSAEVSRKTLRSGMRSSVASMI